MTKPIHIPPSIEDRINEAKQILQPWYDIRKALSESFQARDYIRSDELTEKLLDMLEQVWFRFRYDRLEIEGSGTDWRAEPQLKARVMTLKKQQLKAKEYHDIQDWHQFKMTLDRAEKTISTIIARCGVLIKNNADPHFHQKRRAIALEEAARTNRDKHSMLSQWMQEYQSPEEQVRELTDLPDDPAKLFQAIRGARSEEKKQEQLEKRKRKGGGDGGDVSEV